MDNKLQKAIELIESKKFKKALPIIKKYNRKGVSFLSGELEAACLYQEKLYKQAELLLIKIMPLAQTPEQQLNLHFNLASVYEHLSETGKAVSSYKKAFDIEDSPHNANKKLKFCALLLDLKEYEEALKYSKGLKGINDYYPFYLSMAYASQCGLKNEKEAQKLISLFKSHISNFKTEHLINFVRYTTLYNTTHTLPLLNFIETELGHMDWIDEAKSKLEQGANIAIRKRKANDFPQIDSEDPEITNLITELCNLIISEGGYISPNIQLQYQNGNLAVRYSCENIKEGNLIELPINCTPFLSDYQFSFDENKHIIATEKNQLKNPSAKKALEILLKIYNRSDKFNAWWNNHVLRPIRGNQDVLEKILVPIRRSSLAKKQLFLLLNNHDEAFQIESFFDSRKFSYTKEHLSKANIETSAQREFVLMPVIDFLNHKMGVNGYVVNKKHSGLEITQPSTNYNDELLVQYNIDDPCITFFLYGFVDTTAPFIYSVPLNINIGQLEISIDNAFGFETPTPPDNLLDYKTLYPSGITHSKNSLHLKNLALPVNNKLKRFLTTLEHLLLSSDKITYQNKTKRYLDAIVLAKGVFNANLAYWKEVDSLISSEINNKQLKEADVAMLQELIKHSLTHFTQGISWLNSQ